MFDLTLDRRLIVAEVGQAHDGSLGQAFSAIRSAAEAGADAVKFQLHRPHLESTLEEKFRVPLEGGQDSSRFDYWIRTSFSRSEWFQLRRFASDLGIYFGLSVFSSGAVEEAEALGVDFLKIGSAETNQLWLLEAVAAVGLPTIISTGMSSWKEIVEASVAAERLRPQLVFLQCHSSYPAAKEDSGLNLLAELRDRLQVLSGYSDHTGNLEVCQIALALGAAVVEAHVTFSQAMFGHDSSSSLTFQDLERLVHFRNTLEACLRNPVDKDVVSAKTAPMKELFGRSIAPARRIHVGEVLSEENLLPKKPASGIPWSVLPEVLGKQANRELQPEHLLRWEDFS